MTWFCTKLEKDYTWKWLLAILWDIRFTRLENSCYVVFWSWLNRHCRSHAHRAWWGWGTSTFPAEPRQSPSTVEVRWLSIFCCLLMTATLPLICIYIHIHIIYNIYIYHISCINTTEYLVNASVEIRLRIFSKHIWCVKMFFLCLPTHFSLLLDFQTVQLSHPSHGELNSDMDMQVPTGPLVVGI